MRTCVSWESSCRQMRTSPRSLRSPDVTGNCAKCSNGFLPAPHTNLAARKDWRDLGAHLDTSLRRVNLIGNVRLGNAASAAAAISSLITGLVDKACLVVAKVLPMGLYGCEVAPVNEAGLARLRGAIARGIAPHGQFGRSTTTLLFYGNHCCPETRP